MAIKISGAKTKSKSTVEIPNPSGWTTLLFSDDFDGTTVDSSKWNVRNGNIGTNEQSICYPGNVSVSGSILRIQPKLETTTFGGTTRNYSSGYLDTIGKLIVQRPCRIEMRMALPLASGTSAGMWPAGWLRDESNFGELDIIEASGTPSLQDGTPAEAPAGRYAFHAFPDTRTTTGGKGSWTGPTGLDLTQFHVFAVDILEDGSVYPSLDYSFANQLSFTYASNPFLQTSFPGGYSIRLNLQIGGAWNGLPNAQTDWTQKMQVDWVRCWTR